MTINYEVKFTAEEKQILSRFIGISCKNVPCKDCPFFDRTGICLKGEIGDRVEDFLK